MPFENLKVSILIPVYNRENIIFETLKSAASQTHINTEIIIVDNKSIDNTFKILQKFAEHNSNVKVYQNNTNIGPVLNWRKCLEYSTGDYIKILWSDDLIAPSFIENTLPYLVNNKNIGFVFTGTELFSDISKEKIKAYFIGNTGIYNTSDFIRNSLLNSYYPVSPGNALFRRKDIKVNLLTDIPNRIGSDFKMHAIGNDILIYLLTAISYSKFAFINESLSFFRIHPDSITISSNSTDKELLYYMAKAYFTENYLNNRTLKKMFNKKLAFYFLNHRDNSLCIKSARDFFANPDNFQMDFIDKLKLKLRTARINIKRCLKNINPL
ncbi:MAG: glycosyltransferase family 2 protein [Elusimicrobiota bacterium]